jgi:hypothetical protein
MTATVLASRASCKCVRCTSLSAPVDGELRVAAMVKWGPMGFGLHRLYGLGSVGAAGP